jgi:hypothetical protein
VQIVYPRDPEQQTRILTSFVINDPRGFNYCGVCGATIELAKFEPVDISRVSQQELIELSKKKGFIMCQ